MATLRECRYIVKPLSAGEGIGIKLLDGLGATAPYATMAQSHVIQPYAPRQNQYRSTNSVCVMITMCGAVCYQRCTRAGTWQIRC